MTAKEVLDELKSMGSEITKKTLLKHGAREPFYGVKVQDMKKIQKRIKKDYGLSLELYKSGVTDAMYFAGLIADESKMTKKDLQSWVAAAYWPMLSEYAVPWVTAESKFGHELGREWIESKKENIAAAGWSTLSGLAALKADNDLDIAELKSLLGRVEKEIHKAPNRVRYTMNNFVIAIGASVGALTETALQVANKIGEVYVDMGGTACQVPYAPDYIDKIKQRGAIGKKRKTVRC